MRILVTGSAGFIGFHLCRRWLAAGHTIAGVDGMTPYYDPALKEARHAILEQSPAFSRHIIKLEDMAAMTAAAEAARPEVIVHLAAQAGVRYSLENPRAYVDSNLVGSFNVMELARSHKVAHLIIASTSSVYGDDQPMPFVETVAANHPLTLYAATKKAGEQMTHAYSHLWTIPTTVTRFFTVYGPWGRPDMALFKFVDAILHDCPVDVYNQGLMRRDFTYVDDVIEALDRLLPLPPQQGRPLSDVSDSLSPTAPWRVVNIGRGEPMGLLDFIAEIERALGRKARLNLMPIQPGDVEATFADVSLLKAMTGFTPTISAREGVGAFCNWYRDYHGVH